MGLQKGKPLVNIKRAEVVTEEDVPRTFSFETADEVQVEPFVSEGKEDILRAKNQIIATNRTEDIVVGYNLTLTQNTLIPELLEIIDGGTLTMDTEDPTKVVGYKAPAAGTVVERIPFTINLYSEEKDIDGETINYAKFSFKHNKGTPIKYSLKDGEFFIPEFVVKSRPKTGENPLTVDFIDTLPTL